MVCWVELLQLVCIRSYKRIIVGACHFDNWRHVFCVNRHWNNLIFRGRNYNKINNGKHIWNPLCFHMGCDDWSSAILHQRKIRTYSVPMKFSFICIIIFCSTWIIAATFNVKKGADEYYLYRIYRAVDRNTNLRSERLPTYNTAGIIVFRILGNSITSKSGFMVTSYEGCKIFDIKNWTCTYDDNSSTFGVTNGTYFSILNTTKFPHLANLPEARPISRFEYVVTNCKWYFYESFFVGSLRCAISPFVTN